jgi:hypothetical protein
MTNQTAMGWGKRLRRLLVNVGVLLVSLLVCVVIGEILIRIAVPQQLIVPNHHLWRPDEVIGWRHV